MQLGNIDLILILAYFVGIFFIGISSKKLSKESFLIANRSLNALSLAATIAAGYLGGGFLVIFIGIAYLYGFGAMWIIFGQVIGIILVGLFGNKIKKTADQKKFYTISDYFLDLYGKKVAMLVSILLLCLFFGFTTIQFIAGGNILSGISGWSYQFSVIIVFITIFFYLRTGGFKAIVKTDIFQYVILLFFTVIIAFFLWNKGGPMQFTLFSLGPAKMIAFMIFGSFFVIIGADVWQRAYAAKNQKEMKKGFLLAAALLLLVGFLASGIGSVIRGVFPLINESDALSVGFSYLLPTGLLGPALILLFAAIMSTTDTLLFLSAMNIANDLLPHFGFKKKVKNTQWSLFVIGLLCMLVAILIKNVIDFAFILTASVLTLAPIIIWSYRKPLNPKSIMLAITLTPIVVIVCALTTPLKEELALVSLVISLLSLVIGQCFLRKK